MLNKQYCCQQDWQPLLVSIQIFYDVYNQVRFNQKFAGMFYGRKEDLQDFYIMIQEVLPVQEWQVEASSLWPETFTSRKPNNMSQE